MGQLVVNDVTFDILKMTPREQLHMLRRVTPLMASIGTAALGLLDDEKPREDVLSELAATIGPASEVLSSMSDEQVDYVMNVGLAHVRRLDSDQKWHPIYVRSGATVSRMYQDLDLATELRLVAEVVKENLAGFFGRLSGGSAPPPGSGAGAAQAPSS